MIRRRLLSLGVTVVSLTLGFSASAAVKFVTESPRTAKVDAAEKQRQVTANAGKWIGTRAIIRDEATGQLRKPTRTEVASMIQSLQRLTTPPTTSIKGRVMANGTTRQGSINGGFATVVLGRATADGSIETRCVQTFEEGVEFLGLADEDSLQ